MNFQKHKTKILDNFIFILVIFILYSLSYYFIYGFPLPPWGDIFDGGRPNIIFFIFYGIIPAYIMFWGVKSNYKDKEKPLAAFIFPSFLVGSVLVILIDSVLNMGSGYTEFALFNILPSILFCFFISIYITIRQKKRIS